MRRTRISPGELYTFVTTCEKSNDYVQARQIANYWLCVLCGTKHRGSGHSPMPYSDGERYRCCEKCYEDWVEPFLDQELDHHLTKKQHCEILNQYMVSRHSRALGLSTITCDCCFNEYVRNSREHDEFLCCECGDVWICSDCDNANALCVTCRDLSDEDWTRRGC